MFGRKSLKKAQLKKIQYDADTQKPVLHCSICTGEQAAGLKDLKTGKFQEIMLIRDQEDLELFQKMVGTKEIEKEY